MGGCMCLRSWGTQLGCKVPSAAVGTVGSCTVNAAVCSEQQEESMVTHPAATASHHPMRYCMYC